MQDRYYLYGDRMQDAERQLCMARSVLVSLEEQYGTHFHSYAHEQISVALYSSSPCSHAVEANARVKELEQRDETWRAKKVMLENDLGKAWEENKQLRGAIEWALSYKHNCIAYPDEWFAELRRRAIGEGRGGWLIGTGRKIK